MLKQAETCASEANICREYAISSATFYKWKAKYSGMDASMMKRLRELEEENHRLKRMYANAQMDNEILKETLKGLMSTQMKPLVVWAMETWSCSQRHICELYGVHRRLDGYV